VEARDGFFRLLRVMAAGLALLTSAVVAVGTVSAPLIVTLALGSSYATAARPFRLLLFATGVAVATLWATQRCSEAGIPRRRPRPRRPGPRSWSSCSWTLVPTWGIDGMAWARVGGALG
jgi:hypothetical protein